MPNRISRAAFAAWIAAATLHAALAAQGGPRGLPPVPVPPGNPITTAKVNLGKVLFFEEQLSATRTVACATCHLPEAGGGDPRTAQALHPGPDATFGTADDIHGSPGVISSNQGGSYNSAPAFGLRPQVTGRKAPPVVNAAYNPAQFWDGRAVGPFVDPVTGTALPGQGNSLENQAAEPPLSAIEMAHAGEDWTSLAADLAGAQPLALASNLPAALAAWLGNRGYPALFAEAFGSPAVTPARIVQAIATYQRTLISDQSRFDQFLAGNQNALTPQEQRGLGFFNGPGRCDTCHTGPLLTNQQFFNIGVRPANEDLGRFAVTGQPQDRGAFKVPSLRNVALRGPFFHNGGFRTLREVVRFYARGGDFRQNQTPLIQRFRLDPPQEADLLAFLRALTDPRLAARQAPFDRPTLYSESTRVPQPYGFGSRGVSLALVEPPVLGNPNFTIGLEGGLASGAALLLGDLLSGAGTVPGTGLPLWLAGSPALVARDLGALSGSGHTSLSLRVPATPALAGADLFLQGFALAPGGVGASSGVRVTLFAPR